MKRSLKLYPVISGLAMFMILIALGTCKSIFPEDQSLTKENVLTLMREWYLWNDTIPDVNPADYDSPSALLEAIRLKDIDRWSTIIGSNEISNLYSSSSIMSTGMKLIWDSQDALRIGFVYPGSDPYLAGVERGWQVLQINGQAVTENNLDNILSDSLDAANSFTFKTNTGGSQQYSFNNKIITPESIFFPDTFTCSSRKVGYILMDNFLAQAKDELQVHFQELLAGKINELIIDIRYNTWGVVDISGYMANLIAGNLADKGPFVRYLFNDLKAGARNVTFRFATAAESLTLDRVFFITGEKTSGAAEVLINGLLPYIDVYLIGARTAGRPVGIISQSYPDSTLLPVTYKMANRNNVTDFYNGLTPDSMIPDDLAHALGDKEEACLREVLYYIENGTFSSK